MSRTTQVSRVAGGPWVWHWPGRSRGRFGSRLTMRLTVPADPEESRARTRARRIDGVTCRWNCTACPTAISSESYCRHNDEGPYPEWTPAPTFAWLSSEAPPNRRSRGPPTGPESPGGTDEPARRSDTRRVARCPQGVARQREGVHPATRRPER